MPIHKSEDYKISAVQYYLKNKNKSNVCKIFKCSPRSLSRWINKYNKTGSVKRKDRKYVAYKVKKEYVDFIKLELKKDKTITMGDLLIKLKEKYPDVNLSRYHISCIVNDNNITLKLLRVRREPNIRFKKPIDINKQLNEFYAEIKKNKLEDIICIDETSIKTFTLRNYCYSEIGRRCVVKTESQEVFKKYTGIFAISMNGCLGWELYDKGGIDSDRLYKFLDKNITYKYKNKLIILDNASSHRNAKIKELISKNNKLLYSVPYQHYTNAIENWFSIFKSHLKKSKVMTYEQLKKYIEKYVEIMPLDMYKNIIKGSYDRKRTYKPKKSNRMKPLKIYK